ncbi:MAG: hypothetical protein NDJ89_01160 [Oligoflexia bacterium]|nr:hypothetical protein [Oligoflexia bacterium]
MTTRTIAFLSLLFVMVPISPRGASASPRCEEVVERVGALQVQVIRSSDRCFVNLTPTNISGMVYRSFLVTSEGKLLVFNSYGDGPDSEDTGAREFFFFPRVRETGFAWRDDGTLGLLLVNGEELRVDTATARLRGLTGGELVEAEAVDRRNQGGVEIPRHSGILLDAGYRRGGSPILRRQGSSRFSDPDGKSCTVRNEEVFRYPSTPDGEVGLRHETDAELAGFLRARCPGLRAELLQQGQ